MPRKRPFHEVTMTGKAPSMKTIYCHLTAQFQHIIAMLALKNKSLKHLLLNAQENGE